MSKTNKRIPDLKYKQVNKRIRKIRKHLESNHIQVKALPGITDKSYKTCTNIMNGFRKSFVFTNSIPQNHHQLQLQLQHLHFRGSFHQPALPVKLQPCMILFSEQEAHSLFHCKPVF